jgi:hypothetical protein
MALRDRIARSLSNLKKSGMKTPIIDHVSLQPEVINVKAFDGSYIKEILDRLGIGGNGQTVSPTIVKGHLFGGEPGRWYKYTFPKPLLNPIVTANAKARATDWLNTNIERIQRDDFNNDYYCNLVADGARDRAKKIGPPAPLDGIWNWFCDTFVYWAFFAAWFASGWILNVLWDSFIQKQIDRAQTALNKRITDLFQMWGLPHEIALASVMLKNINSTGFEFLSLGNMDVYFTAIGD